MKELWTKPTTSIQGEFWKVPPRLALLDTRDAIRKELLPKPDETWREKVSRAADALRHPGQPSLHDEPPRGVAR